MRLIDEFVKKALTENGSFTINHQEHETPKHLFFMQGSVGEAKYIYGTYSWRDAEFFAAPYGLKLELTAIVADGTVYIVNTFMLNAAEHQLQKRSNPFLPEHTKYLSSEIEEKKEYFKNTVFPEFLASLETEEITDDAEKERLKKDARKALLSKTPEKWLCVEAPDIITGEDVAKNLCKMVDIKEVAKARLEENRNTWTQLKSQTAYVNELATKKAGMEGWEIPLAEILRHCTAKFVTVHFELNGSTATGKIPPETIIRKLVEKDDFSTYDFETGKIGEEVYNKLGIYDKWSQILTCDRIERITYSKQAIYEKSAYNI